MKFSWRGEPLELRPERGLFLPERGALLVADVHVGKAEAFQRRGVPVPSGVGAADLARLSATIDACAARSLWVLGDLVHDRDALETTGLAELRARHRGVEFHVVCGNHDRHVAELPAAWGFEPHGVSAAIGPFVLRHEPEGCDDDLYTLCGHLHPMTKVQGAGDQLLLPCFQFGPRIGLLPAFTSWSSGVRVDPADGRTFVIAGDRVVGL
ncbi:MAG: ligase-associated DNA damage response endonuclease PdeM [Planctomycetota bacterium]|nr:ligase-associated DNA damage response endonuclease PdeM [Planctomycetota bacterium]MEC8253306.1 ligase-associated DNA damage response endonuclease PdeM [Planctomycetota bacterium]MEC8651682.1 ligase-associated DNA damage response endonuclease PdeM [Planctomycetota bacterium]